MANTPENGGGAAAKLATTDRRLKVKLMCSYGGKIQPRPPNQQLVYIGGDAKLLTGDRNIKFSDVTGKLSSLYNIFSEEVSLKYQFPGEDLDVLISLINDDDLENMMFEYDRLLNKVLPPSSKPARFRLFLYRVNKPEKRSPNQSGESEGPFNPDYLFGFDKEYDYCNKSNRLSGFDLGIWTIPSPIGSGRTGGHDNGKRNDEQRKAGPQLIHSTELAGQCAAGAGVQLIYRVPPPPPPPQTAVNTVDFHDGLQYRMVPVPMGIVNGFREIQIYNVVPTLLSTVVPEQMKIPAATTATIDKVSLKRKV